MEKEFTVTPDNQYLIDFETFQRNPKTTTREGISSVIAATSLLMMDEVDGFDDPLDLLSTLWQNRLAGNLSLKIPFGIIAPMVNRGRYFKNPLDVKIRNGQREVRLSHDFNEYLGELDKKDRATPGSAGVRKLGCPLGYRNVVSEENLRYTESGITRITEVMYPFMEHFYTTSAI
jgi:hypothetical protein